MLSWGFLKLSIENAWHTKFHPVFRAEILDSSLYIRFKSVCLAFLPTPSPGSTAYPLPSGTHPVIKTLLLEKFLLLTFGLIDFVLAQDILDLTSVSSSA